MILVLSALFWPSVSVAVLIRTVHSFSWGGTLSATVLLKPESVECGAEPPLFSEDKIIDELKQYNFEPLKDGTAQYRVVKVAQDGDAWHR